MSATGSSPNSNCRACCISVSSIGKTSAELASSPAAKSCGCGLPACCQRASGADNAPNSAEPSFSATIKISRPETPSTKSPAAAEPNSTTDFRPGPRASCSALTSCSVVMPFAWILPATTRAAAAGAATAKAAPTTAAAGKTSTGPAAAGIAAARRPDPCVGAGVPVPFPPLAAAAYQSGVPAKIPANQTDERMQQRRPRKGERPANQERKGDKRQQKSELAAVSGAQAGTDRKRAKCNKQDRKRQPDQERVDVQIGLLDHGRWLIALDDFGDAIDGGGQTVGITLLAKGRKELFSENAAGERVRQNWRQAVADCDAGYAILNGDEQ